jgi:hypothetical protein
MADPTYRKTIAVSHVADLSGYIGREAGGNRKTDWQCITKIDVAHGVDWVTRPGARGRVAESDRQASEQENEDMDLTKLTLSELRAANPTLVAEIESAATKPLQDELTALKKTVNESAAERRKERVTAAVNEAVKDKAFGIPATAQESIAARATANVLALKAEETDGDKLAGAVKTVLEAEAKMVRQIQGKPEVAVESSAPKPSAETNRASLQSFADRLA